MHDALNVIANIWNELKLLIAQLSKVISLCLNDVIIEDINVVVSIGT